MTATNKIFVEWKGNLCLQAHNEKSLTADFDAPKEHGGNETALPLWRTCYQVLPPVAASIF
ncbi:MAG: hypothetical protein FWE56_02485 [Candidatus Bathyarchaeota archaeon]|nr:hypothetical protein [Candidatus Termiticorpusculum sp.]MCL2868255.1 hypothetical protein [Candidatus Termiticorpusculum sp.]